MTEVRSVSSTGGEKGVKEERFDLLPWEAIGKVARHYAKGAEKYEAHNWRRGYEWSKSYAALMRHLTAFWSGEDIDEETGSPHMAAVVFHALALLTFMDEQPGFDDRYKPESDWMTESERAAYDRIIKVGDLVIRADYPKEDPYIYQVLNVNGDVLTLRYGSLTALPFEAQASQYVKV
jgi:hypothetical protein